MGWILLKLAGVGGWLKTLPWQVWAGIALLLIVVVGVRVHGCAVDQHYQEAYKAGARDTEARWQETFAKMQAETDAWRHKYESEARRISAETGGLHAQEIRDNASAADALRVRGPGAAACSRPVSDTGLPTTAGGHDAPGGVADAAVAAVPAGETMAAVPWAELVGFASSADDNRSEVTAWRTWYVRNEALLRESKEALTKH